MFRKQDYEQSPNQLFPDHQAQIRTPQPEQWREHTAPFDAQHFNQNEQPAGINLGDFQAFDMSNEQFFDSVDISNFNFVPNEDSTGNPMNSTRR